MFLPWLCLFHQPRQAADETRKTNTLKKGNYLNEFNRKNYSLPFNNTHSA
jgi:hypothetical protein